MKHGVTVYQYVLTYKGEHSFANIFYGIMEPKFVCHADDLLYQWKFSMDQILDITLNEVTGQHKVFKTRGAVTLESFTLAI